MSATATAISSDLSQQGEDENPEDPGNPEGSESTNVRPVLDEGLKNFISEAMDKIDALASERSSINSKISAIVEEVEAKGVNRHAFKYMMKMAKMDEDQREAIDYSYGLCRQAKDIPIQAELFK